MKTTSCTSTTISQGSRRAAPEVSSSHDAARAVCKRRDVYEAAIKYFNTRSCTLYLFLTR